MDAASQRRLVTSMLLIFLLGRAATAPAQQAVPIPLRPVTMVEHDAPVDNYEPTALPQRFERAAPAVALEAPAQQRERFPVRRTAWESNEETSAAQPPNRIDALQVYRQSLEAASPDSAALRPMSLLQAIGKSTDRAAQLAIVRQYWIVATAESANRWTSANRLLLQSLPQPQDQRDQHALVAAIASTTARSAELEVASLNARQKLLEEARLSGDLVFHASDLPIVGQYQANFGAIFAQRSAPPRVVHLARLLPIQQRIVSQRAEAVQAAEWALQETVRRYESGQAELHTVQEDLRRLEVERTAFLGGIRDYNSSIAEYSLSVVGKSHSNATLVSTLVRRESASPAAPGDTRSSPNESNARRQSSAPADSPRSASREPARLRSAPTGVQTPHRISTAPRSNARPSGNNLRDDSGEDAAEPAKEIEHGTQGDDPEGPRTQGGALRRGAPSPRDDEVQPASATSRNRRLQSVAEQSGDTSTGTQLESDEHGAADHVGSPDPKQLPRRIMASNESKSMSVGELNQDADTDGLRDVTDASEDSEQTDDAASIGHVRTTDRSRQRTQPKSHAGDSSVAPRRSKFRVPFQLDAQDLDRDTEEGPSPQEAGATRQGSRAKPELPAADENPPATEPPIVCSMRHRWYSPARSRALATCDTC